MTSTSTTTSLAFKSWNNDNGDEPPLKDILSRVHTERGHFRNITEATLQEEIAAEGGIEMSSSDDEDEEEDDGEAKEIKRQPPKDRNALFEARKDMVQGVGEALQTTKNSLWSIAMLQSKYQPSVAAHSLPRDVKALAPSGSFAGDIWDPERGVMPKNAARKAQDGLLATKIRMRELQDSADSLLAAATRLKENVRKETLFWDEVMSVSERGWRISRIPGTHLLGVHYGFQGCDPAFARSEIAAITSDSNGTVMLERGIGTQPKAVRTVLRKKGQVVGSSRLPSIPDDEETTLEARIRHARDSVYDEELFHELLRESRSLTSIGVTTKGSAVHFTSELQGEMEVELQLVSLDEDNTLGLEASHDYDTLARAILLTARLMLGQEHRNKLGKKKDLPPPLSSKQDEKQQHAAILRPLILVLDHHAQVRQLNTYLKKMCNLLRVAGMSAESQAARTSLPISADGSVNMQDLTASLLRPLKAEGTIWLIASDAVTLELKLTAESFVWNTPGSSFTIYPPGGQPVRVFSLEELFLAADDFLTMALAQLLKELAGEGWSLDRREGMLTRTRNGGARQSLQFEVSGASGSVGLRATGTDGEQEVSWKSDGSSDAKPLSDAWKDLVD